jgi:hypothetical protein
MVEISIMPARLSCTNDAITISRPEGLMLIYDLAVINTLYDTREDEKIDLSYRNQLLHINLGGRPERPLFLPILQHIQAIETTANVSLETCLANCSTLSYWTWRKGVLQGHPI